ncbi:MAG: 50S ribosomal protein L11 methyltransferase [Deltaproteobacteria bacterium]|jgi:ribosomal protein L11 methyltransferase|nr:50S ribosomal protein L11 methyltransferase [Deltaproteobacteria bacterium]
MIHEKVTVSRRRLTFKDLEKQIGAIDGVPKSLVRAAIRSLIEAGILEYRYTFGQSYLELSFRNPVEVSNVFTIVPPGYTGQLPPHRLPIAISPGVSFGSGRHPTTRLSLQALESTWAYRTLHDRAAVQTVLDIGTGSGILAIAASCLGASTITALDIDACARAEARLNVGLNPGAEGVQVSDRPLSSFNGRFDLVIANLRQPTLVALSGWVASHLAPSGCLVVSGFRDEEQDRLLACYADHGFQPLWQKELAGWCAALLGVPASLATTDDPSAPANRTFCL